MTDPKLTPDQYAELIKLTKPHLIEIEDRVKEVEYGELDVKLTVRAGVIEKMNFYENKVWMRPKEATVDSKSS